MSRTRDVEAVRFIVVAWRRRTIGRSPPERGRKSLRRGRTRRVRRYLVFVEPQDERVAHPVGLIAGLEVRDDRAASLLALFADLVNQEVHLHLVAEERRQHRAGA